MRRFLLVSLLAVVCLLCSSVGHAQSFTVGPQQTVMTNSQAPSCCYPDSNLGAQLIGGTYYLFGSGFNNAGVTNVGITTGNLDTLWGSATSNFVTSGIQGGGSGSFDQNYQGGGPFYYDSATGLMIMVYHGEYWYNPPSFTPFTSGLGLAVSSDLGRTWTRLGPIVLPNIQRATLPGCFNPNFDVGGGSMVVRSDGYVYVYFVDTLNSDTPNCDFFAAVARAPLSSVIAAAQAGGRPSGTLFQKYYMGSFSQPGVNDSNDADGGGLFSSIASFLVYEPTVAFDSYLGQYVMAYDIPWTGSGLAFSPDGITWSNNQNVITGGTDPGGGNAYLYNSMFNTPSTGGGNPNTLGQSFYLYFTNPYPSSSWASANLKRVLISFGGAAQAATPTPSQPGGTYASAISVSLSTTSTGAIICWTNDGSSPATNGTTGCSHGTLYTGAISVASSLTLKYVAGGTGSGHSYTDSSVGSATYIIGSPPPSGNVYISQAGGGSGGSCGSTLSVIYFNTSGNWSLTPTGAQIGPGVTVHLCGTFTGTANTTMLTAQGAGATGNPVTIKFESGATLTSPAWGTAIVLDGHDHFVIDGGTTCGRINGTLVSCNGSIQNTLNGTSGNTCPGGTCTQHVTGSLAISASPSNDVEIKNLAILNMYLVSGGEDVGGPPGPGCIHFYPTTTLNNWSIHNDVFTWAGWCLNGGANNLAIYNNDFHFIDHGLGMGQFTDATANFNNIAFHDNRYHDAYVWDSPSNDFHHDGVHLFSYSASQHTNLNATITGINIYNNLFDGDMGDNNTAMIFFEGQEVGANIFNNVGIVFPGRQVNNGLYNGYGKNINTFNNTVIGPPCSVSMMICTTTQTQKYSIFTGPGQLVKNNAYTDGGMISVNQPYPFDCPGTVPCQTVGYTLSSNAYIAPGDFANGFGSLINGFYNYNLSGFTSFEADTAEMGGIFTDNGIPTSTYFNILTGSEKSGSPTIKAGTNLTSLCVSLGISGNPCNFDIAGNPRPASGAWDVGAYLFTQGGLPPSAPGPPTGLVAVPF